jgi:hypothetical protein
MLKSVRLPINGYTLHRNFLTKFIENYKNNRADKIPLKLLNFFKPTLLNEDKSELYKII